MPPTRPSGAAIDPAAQSYQAAPGPTAPGFRAAREAVPVLPAAPFTAPRPLAQSPAAPLPYDPERSAMVARDFAQRVSATSAAAAAPVQRSHVLAVVLVVLAAAIAAITVYFVLPLLT